MTPPAADPVVRIGERLHVLAAGAERIVEVVARASRMRATELHALVAIASAEQAGAPATPGDLAQALRLTTGAITGLVDRLVRSGHVRREADTADRRRVRLVCREAGRAAASELLHTLAGRANAVLLALTAEERGVVDRFLDDVGFATTAYLHTHEIRRPLSD
ncbi:MarR family winged helix-turn-helix transcriptional regulator [Pseudonocardia xishanensis]|uniref:MarR family winged helix-turn-helix transcriptional regulator n=1 Tax=Pseudonocardia xishanensis TaxID=630995 RepID=A0ABP8RIS6_9PSEU